MKDFGSATKTQIAQIERLLGKPITKPLTWDEATSLIEKLQARSDEQINAATKVWLIERGLAPGDKIFRRIPKGPLTFRGWANGNLARLLTKETGGNQLWPKGFTHFQKKDETTWTRISIDG